MHVLCQIDSANSSIENITTDSARNQRIFTSLHSQLVWLFYKTIVRLHGYFTYYYYRTAAGVEIDFLVETQKRQQSTPAHVVCIEIKYSKKWNR